MPTSRGISFFVLLGFAVLTLGCEPVSSLSQSPNGVALATTPARSPDASRRIISKVVMAEATAGTEKAPINVTTSFPENQAEFHAVVTLSDAPNDTHVRIVWRVVDDGNPSRANADLAEYELVSDGSRNLDFTLKPNGGRMPPGSYRADVYLNGELNQSLRFSVTASP